MGQGWSGSAAPRCHPWRNGGRHVIKAVGMAGARQQTAPPRPALRGHSALARSLAPASDAASEVMAGATDRAARKLNDLARRAGHAGFPAARRAVAAAGIAATTEAIRIYRAGGVLSGMGELAWLSVVMADPWVRDDALTRPGVDPRYHRARRRLWTDVPHVDGRQVKAIRRSTGEATPTFHTCAEAFG